MVDDQDILERIRKVIARRRNFEEKRMFGGYGFLFNRHMCFGVLRNELILQIGRAHV